MTTYEKIVEMPVEELALFRPFEKRSPCDGPLATDMAERFEQIEDSCVSWNNGYSYADPWYDRTVTVKFDNEHVFDIGFNYYDGQEDYTDLGYWYLFGVRFGDADDVIQDYEQTSDDYELLSTPKDSVEGDYVYRVGNDEYVISIVEA